MIPQGDAPGSPSGKRDPSYGHQEEGCLDSCHPVMECPPLKGLPGPVIDDFLKTGEGGAFLVGLLLVLSPCRPWGGEVGVQFWNIGVCVFCYIMDWLF